MIDVPATIRRALALPLLICLLAPTGALAGQTDPPPPATESYASYPTRAEGPVLHPGTLNDVLEELDLPEPESLTLLDRLLLWLEEYFSDDSTDAFPDWLNDFRFSPVVAEAIFYAACALIVGLAIAIIANEIRHLNGRSGSRVTPSAGGRAFLPDDGSAAVLNDLPLFDRPAHLLNVILGRLSTAELNHRPSNLTGHLTRSLTHRDILTLSLGLREEEREPLHQLTRVAEQIRYADAPPPQHAVVEAVDRAQVLIQDRGP